MMLAREIAVSAMNSEIREPAAMNVKRSLPGVGSVPNG
jgi:hypothetical protein